MAAIYFFIWAAFVWSCFRSQTVSGDNPCPSTCDCLGDYIDCSRMGLIEVPKDLPTWVTDLEIQSNGISSLHPDDFKGLLQLTKIDLSNNEISFINETVFLNVPALKELKINSNKLTELPILKGNPLLTRLELIHNDIHTINPRVLSDLKQLDTLDLSYNDLMEIQNGTFPANLTITKISLKNNKILHLEAGCFYNLTTLESLRLNKNKLSHLPKDVFSKLTNLRSLDLSKNQLNKLSGLAFRGLEGLQVLKLRKNAINTLEDGVFFGLKKLHSLQTLNDLSTYHLAFDRIIYHFSTWLPTEVNQQYKFGEFMTNNRLRLRDCMRMASSLQLDENNLTIISQNWLYGLDNLKELSLSFNKIVKIEPSAWEYVPQLVTLNVINNMLVTLASDSFTNLPELTSLLLANNHIEVIQDGAFKQLTVLEELNLNNNAISSTIEDVKGAFEDLSTLKKLSLMSNKIKTITKQAFNGLTSLEGLSLENNNITSIQGNAFEVLPQLRQLAFNTSSLFCDCQLSWIPMWLRDNNFERDVVAKCAHPEHLKNRNIFVVDSNEFKCDGHFPKPVIVMNPRSQVILKGENITLNCTAASTEAEGSPTKFQWKKDNVLLTDVASEDYAQRSGNLTHYVSRLHLKDAQDVDAGRYQCVISNEFGSAYSKRANINVYVYPKFTKRPQNVTVKAGTKATLVCAAEGQPKPTISWQKDGGFDHFPAAQERRMHVIPEDDHFYIVDVKAADEGNYSCIAKNEAGTIVVNVTLTVLQTPSFARPMEGKEAKIGSTAVLECLAQGSPQPKLTWYRDDKPLVLSQRHFFTAENQLLVIVETEVRDAGQYTCEMSNTLGTIRGTSTLTVITGSGVYEPKDGNSGGGLDDESTTTGIIIIAVVCCVVGTSLVWVIIIYQTRKRQELYSATPTDETTLPGEVPSSGYISSDKEGSYSHGAPVTTMPGYQYHDMQMKESGYESSSGRFRAARSAAIFPSDVDDNEMLPNYDQLNGGHYVEQSDENSLSSHEYPRSDTDSIKSEVNSVNSSQSSRQQILSTFHPHAASREQLGMSRSRSCSESQTPSDTVSDKITKRFDTGQLNRSHGDMLENSVSSQTDDDLEQNERKGYSPCGESDATANSKSPGVKTNNNIVNIRNNLVCRNCGESGPHLDSATHQCKHNNSPPVIPPKPGRLRYARRKDTHFDRARPPGPQSRSSNDVRDYYEYDDIPPPPPPIVQYPNMYIHPDYSGHEGMYLANGHGPVGPVPGTNGYVPVYHPMNAPCDCHLHYTPPTQLNTDQRNNKDFNNLSNSTTHNHSNTNQRVNGIMGCVHHHMNGMSPPPAWHGHAYTLPYHPGHHMHHPVQVAPTRTSPRQQQQQISPRHKEQSLSRQQIQPCKTDNSGPVSSKPDKNGAT